MALRAPPRFFERRRKINRKGRSGTKDIVTGGVTALLGIGLLGATASAFSRI